MKLQKNIWAYYETQDILSKLIVVSNDVCDSTIVRAKCGTAYTNWLYMCDDGVSVG